MAPADSKEKRRSTRRSAHSSTKSSGSSGSPSPDAASLPPPPALSDAARSAASSSSTSTARAKRAKDDQDDFHAPTAPSHRRTTSVASATNGAGASAANSHPPAPTKRAKRRGKDVVVPTDDVADTTEPDGADPAAGPEKPEEDAGITRCVCEGLDDDGDAPDFMVQCEQCMVWQHGPCVGFAREEELPEGDYYCELCKPEDHVDLLKKLARRQRQSSEKSALASQRSRTSRSHSPTHFLKTAKRRNTMNSRDAAYEESIKALLDATAAEAEPGLDNPGNNRAPSVARTEEPYEEIVESGAGGRKKRKRADDEVMPTKRKRSTSVVSESYASAVGAIDKPDVASPITTALLPPPAPKSRARRGGGRKSAAAPESSVNGDGEEGISTTKKHPNQYTYRTKSGNGPARRAPQSLNGQNQQNISTHDHGTRRNANNAANGGGASGAGSRSGHNAYYNNMQLPMFATWGLPDYLNHLQSILPSDVPPPLQIRGATSFLRDEVGDVGSGPGGEGTNSAAGVGANGDSSVGETADVQNTQIPSALSSATESVTERGVKVKWPAKRMSVADMNKRVRALVEWVGREQALAADRERRKTSLENALHAQSEANRQTNTSLAPASANVSGTAESVGMLIDGAPIVTSPEQERKAGLGQTRGSTPRFPFPSAMEFRASNAHPATSKMMEELMEELISFQERFGPGAKGQARERRIAALA